METANWKAYDSGKNESTSHTVSLTRLVINQSTLIYKVCTDDYIFCYVTRKPP